MSQGVEDEIDTCAKTLEKMLKPLEGGRLSRIFEGPILIDYITQNYKQLNKDFPKLCSATEFPALFEADEDGDFLELMADVGVPQFEEHRREEAAKLSTVFIKRGWITFVDHDGKQSMDTKSVYYRLEEDREARANPSGILEVIVVKGSGISASSNPYVVVRCSSVPPNKEEPQRTTQTVKEDLAWATTFKIKCPDMLRGHLQVEVYDTPKLKGTRMVFNRMIPLDIVPLHESRYLREWYKVHGEGKKKQNGKLELMLASHPEGAVEHAGADLTRQTAVWEAGEEPPFDPAQLFWLETPYYRVFDPAATPFYRVQEEPPAEVNWFRRIFHSAPHFTYMSTHAEFKVPALLQVLGTADEGGDTIQWWCILWSQEAIVRRVVYTKKEAEKQTVPVPAILQAISPSLTDKQIQSFHLMNPEMKRSVGDTLVKVENDEATPRIKIGVLLAVQGQTDETDMYCNQHGTDNFNEFLSYLGIKMRLKGYEGYTAQLDNKSDNSGLFSVARTFNDMEVMFHVSTLMQWDPTDPQRIQRKRFIGNDVVMIVFMDGNTTYNVDCMRSQYTNNIYVVQYDGKKPGEYKFAGGSKKTVRPSGPDNAVVYAKGQEFANFLITKCINGQRATYASPEFVVRAKRTRASYLEMIAKDLDKLKNAKDVKLPIHDPASLKLFVDGTQAFSLHETEHVFDGRCLAAIEVPDNSGAVVVGTTDGVYLVPPVDGTVKIANACAVVGLAVHIASNLCFVHVSAAPESPSHAEAKDPSKKAKKKEKKKKGLKSLFGGGSSKDGEANDVGVFIMPVAVFKSKATSVLVQPDALGRLGDVARMYIGTAGGEEILCTTTADTVVLTAIVGQGMGTKFESRHEIFFPIGSSITYTAVVPSGLLVGAMLPNGDCTAGAYNHPNQDCTPLGESGKSPVMAILAHLTNVWVCYPDRGVLFDGATGKKNIAVPPVTWTNNEPVFFHSHGPFMMVQFPTFLEVRAMCSGALVESHPLCPTMPWAPLGLCFPTWTGPTTNTGKVLQLAPNIPTPQDLRNRLLNRQGEEMVPPTKEEEAQAEVEYQEELVRREEQAKIAAKLKAKKGPCFGVSLESILTREEDDLPNVFRLLSKAIVDLGGEKEEGLFRVPAPVDEINDLRDSLHNGAQKVNTKDPQVAAGVFKLWFRQLPDPLIPSENYRSVVDAEGTDALVAAVEAIPPMNKVVLDALGEFLVSLAVPETVAYTKMPLDSLSMVFAPSLLRNPSDDLSVVMADSTKEKAALRNYFAHLASKAGAMVNTAELKQTTSRIGEEPLEEKGAESTNGEEVEGDDKAEGEDAG